MGKGEVVLSDLSSLVSEKDYISDKLKKNKWFETDYETGEISGKMLVAGENSFPPDITIKLGLKGWHRIYIATLNFRSRDYFHIRLTGDEAFSSVMGAVVEKKETWCPTEYAEEMFYKCADLTDRNLILSKPEYDTKNACSLLFIRCVKMNNKEVDEYRKYYTEKLNPCVFAHSDLDTLHQDGTKSMEKLLIKEKSVCNTDVEKMMLETTFDIDKKYRDDDSLLLYHQNAIKPYSDYIRREKSILKSKISYLHKNNKEVYAALRMSVCNFYLPYNNDLVYRLKYPESHKKFYSVLRDDTVINVCSYAYKEVREYMINNIKNVCKQGFDGVTLIFNRGLLLGFEKPVIERFKVLYPGINPKMLPNADKRLNGVWSEFMTAFMEELKEELKKSFKRGIKISVVVDMNITSCKNLGIDVEKWCKLGLVDSICQGSMENFQDLEGCLLDNGLIDIKKYSEKLKTEPVEKRFYFADLDKIKKGAAGFVKLSKKYNVDFYGTLPWEQQIAGKDYQKWADELRKIGVEKFLSWNYNHCMRCLPEYHAITSLGHKYKIKDSIDIKSIRILSLGGSNIKAFNPNWRG